MKRKKHIISLLLVVALLLTTVCQIPMRVKAKGNTKKMKYYTISKKAGTYTSAIKVKIKVKKGYKVFYQTSGTFKKSKVIKGGKSKIINIKKTTVLSLCTVKKSMKITNKKLNKMLKKNKKICYEKYKYIIEGSSKSATSTDTASPVITGNPSVAVSPAVTGTPSVAASPDATGGIIATATPGASTSVPVQTPPAGGKPDNTGMPEGTPPTESIAPGNPPFSGTATANPEENSEAQEKLNDTENDLAVNIDTPVSKTPSAIEDNTPVISLTANGMTTENLEDGAVVYAEQGDLKTLTIRQAGTYVLKGGTVSDPVTNIEIIVAENISEAVNLIWDNLIIDNQALGDSTGEDVPVFYVKTSTQDVHVTLKGSSALTGNGAYTESPAAAVICAEDTGTKLTFSAYEGDSTASLTVVDSMDAETNFGENDPSDGIYCKGMLALQSGTYSVSVNGDCLKGTGKKGNGGICIYDGTYTLHSAQGSALKSKNGNIVVQDGTVKSTYTAGDGIQAKNYSVIITGGTLGIDQCYGDGIQGENVNISGDDTVVDIKTYFENAGINYYNSALGSGNYNTMSSTNGTKTEAVNVDTGSHKGIKGGTKACSYRYESVEDGSDYVAGTVYTTEASGGIVIAGGTITVDTTKAGIKYNGGGGGMISGGRPGSSSSSSGNLSAANSDGQYIIGAPDDGIHSNNTCVIAGGTLKILSSDDGITSPAEMIMMNGCDISIEKCYEGIEGGEIIIGSSQGAASEPVIKIYSDDDGVNASSKSKVSYVYQDESEEKYTKTQTSSSGNTLTVLSGYLNVMIADDESHSFSLSNADGTTTTGSYTSDGDGIDCNGAFYAYGVTVVVYGPNSDGNSAIDTDGAYYIGSGVTLLAVGKSGMAESPTNKEQPLVVYGGSSYGFGGMRPGPGGNQGGSSSISAGTAFAIMKDNDTLLAIKPTKNYNYVLYTSPELEAGSSYTVYCGGSVSGSPLQADSSAYDYRYTEYDVSGASILSTVTAQN